MTETLTIIQVIQLILAPAVMINASGLLLLGVANRFSLVLNRIRLLNEERRKLRLRNDDQRRDMTESQRIESISLQLRQLVQRGRLLRNAVAGYFLAVGIFVMTSVLIGLDYLAALPGLRVIILPSFLIGLVILFCGVAFAALDTFKAFEIVRFDVAVDE